MKNSVSTYKNKTALHRDKEPEKSFSDVLRGRKASSYVNREMNLAWQCSPSPQHPLEAGGGGGRRGQAGQRVVSVQGGKRTGAKQNRSPVLSNGGTSAGLHCKLQSSKPRGAAQEIKG